jgi:hypothetical protein
LHCIGAVIASEAKQSLEIATSLTLLAMTALDLSKQTIFAPLNKNNSETERLKVKG